MNILERLRQFLRQQFGLSEARMTGASAGSGDWWGPEPPGNDAEAYGVAIEEAEVEEGQPYWRVVRVHHLTPEENGGKHHIFLDILDEAGERVYDAQARVTWEGGEQVITVDKPHNEPGTNFPMWKWQVCAVEALGLPGQTLPSDRVVNLHTGHPDEAPGNTLFHHSFAVVFQRTTKGAAQESVVEGTVHNGAGRDVLLLLDEEMVASQMVGADERYRFEGLGAGTYVVAVAGTDVRSAPIVLDGRNAVTVDLTLAPPTESVIEGVVTNGAGRVIVLYADGVEVARQVIDAEGNYRFEGLAAGTYVVAVEGTDVRSEPITLDGRGAAAINLEVPAEVEEKLLAEYVLFGPPDAAGTRTNLLLALDYLLAVQPTFGFRVEEAQRAQRVLIIGGTEAVSAEAEAALVAAGCEVERIAGDSYTVERLLAERIS